MQEWVAVEKSISRESESWRSEKASIEDRMLVLGKEVELLGEELKIARMKSNKSNSHRKNLLANEAELHVLHERIETFLVRMEGELLEFAPVLPEPLESKLLPMIQRIPLKQDIGSLGVAERMQTVVTILAEIQRFNGGISLSVDLREQSDGSYGEAKTLYLGLASAYYIIPSTGEAGFGWPEENTWVWQVRPELKNSILDAMEIYEGATQEARFVALPIEVDSES